MFWSLNLWPLLPYNAQLGTVGGSGFEYDVAGNNYSPDSKTDPEAGSWRIELSPSKESKQDFFCTVLQASLSETKYSKSRAPKVKLLKSGAGIVVVEIRSAGVVYTVSFKTAGKPGGSITATKGKLKIFDTKFPTKIVLPKRDKGWGE